MGRPKKEKLSVTISTPSSNKSALLEKMRSAGSVKNTSVVADSPFFNERDSITTELPILNTAFSGDLAGGYTTGLTMIAGDPATYKSLLGLYCMRAYFKKYPDAIGILYDTEFGISPEYLLANGIDPSRVIHIPIEHIEQLKFDIAKRIDAISRGDKVFILVDSVGNLASKKESEDALKEHEATDMTRPKALKSLMRIIIAPLVIKDIPCVIINHTYNTLEMFSKPVVSGGKGVSYAAQQTFIITKAKEVDNEKELIGYKFTIHVEKSRTVKEKSKLPLVVSFANGINKYSGMLDLALESGDVTKPKNGWYALVDGETGEELEPMVREVDTYTEEFLGKVLQRPKFQEFIKSVYKLQSPEIITDVIVQEEMEELIDD